MTKLVVWFPGLGSFANVTGNILEFFEKDPDTDVVCLSYDTYGRAGYRKAAKRLVGPLEAMLDNYDVTYFLGHSMGGAVAETLVTDFGFKPDKLVTISTPPAPLKIKSPFSTGVWYDFSQECVLPEVPLLKLYGSFDLLSHPKSPLFEYTPEVGHPSERSERIDGHGHLSILWSPRAAAEVYSFCTYT